MSTPNEPAEAPAGLLAKLHRWSADHPRANLFIGVAFAAATLLTVGSWLTLAEIAVAEEEATVARAIEALDRGEDEAARAIIAELQTAPSLSAEDYSGVFYVLGAIKAREADKQWSPDRARTDHYVAAQYLKESGSLGFPADRRSDALFLLGRSLIESRQLDEGVIALQQAIEAGAQGEARAHLLLARAYFGAPTPDYPRTIEQADAALGDASLDREGRSEAAVMRAESLAALGRGAEAQEALRDASTAEPPLRALVEGKALLAAFEADKSRPPSKADAAIAALERARRLDKLATPITRQSDFLKARITALLGRRDEAIAAYAELRRNDGASDTGVAASFAEAELLLDAGEPEKALESFRRGVDAIDDVQTYRNPLLSLADARRTARGAVDTYAGSGDFRRAIALTDRLETLVGAIEQLELRAVTLRRWGDALIAEAEEAGYRGRPALREGRRRLRESGMAYEALAKARYATRQYTDDLWRASQAFHEGQAYADEVRLLKSYLREEPVKRNALALLRLGEAYLSRGEDGAAIAAFNECLEFHPSDASSFRARLECAKAHHVRGDVAAAEDLLQHNLKRTALTPISSEWRDSKFELGELLADTDRHDDAIRELEEAVARYPDDPHTLTAKYLIAEAHRHAAQEPLALYRDAKTVNERELARSEAVTHLEAALAMYREVQSELTLAGSGDELDLVTRRNCYALSGEVLFELGRYEEAIQAFSNVSALYQNEPYMLEAFVQISYCWRRKRDRPKALGVIQQARLLLDRLPPDADFASPTNLTRPEWDRLLTQLSQF
ncbi:MAG: tetratricopeptide repeat protein [Planctomycetota bacterium]